MLKKNTTKEEIVNAVIDCIKPLLNQVPPGETFTVKLVHKEKAKVIHFKREANSSDYTGEGFKQVYNANIICLNTGGTKISFPEYQASPPRSILDGPAESISAFRNKVGGFFSGISNEIKETKAKAKRATSFDMD